MRKWRRDLKSAATRPSTSRTELSSTSLIRTRSKCGTLYVKNCREVKREDCEWRIKRNSKGTIFSKPKGLKPTNNRRRASSRFK